MANVRDEIEVLCRNCGSENITVNLATLRHDCLDCKEWWILEKTEDNPATGELGHSRFCEGNCNCWVEGA